ncbi:LPS export ABC transporter permease LptG [Palleronia abyssalis]|uniref:Lipopolysaccharide export system permease protein LptG n=1 Tax=Palleronia abyssalis TaxID=1501240 RepID=A0A2R8BV74_9RHOB|nr:LPS export ABC transporter permease LptG [Palleronia abyssalis]SPJ24030.1 Lipopolysaccharide export system permease protein LptG [Palleronia abyssalis]
MILHIYFARRFAGTFLLVLGVFLGILILIDLVDQVRRFEDDAVGFVMLIGLTLLSVPRTLYSILPLITIIATLTLFLSLARTSELVVSRASGRSAILSLLGPLVVTFLIGTIAVAALNPIAAGTARQYDRLSDRLQGVSGPALSMGREGVWLRQADVTGQTVIHATGIDDGGTVLRDATFLTFDDAGTALSRAEAATAVLLDEEWQLRQAKRWDFSDPNPEAASMDSSMLILPSSLSAQGIADSFSDPASVPIWQLPRFIQDMQAAGFSAQAYIVGLHATLALPAMLMAMVLVGAAFTMRHTRFGRTGRMVLLALASGFSLFFLNDFAQILGENGQISAILAAWGPPVAAICLPLGLILHWEDG